MIPFNKPYTNHKEIKAMKNCLKSGWITTGPITKQFENEFADYVGSKYAVAVSSCTSALELCLLYMNLSKKDKVVVPSFTFAATAQAVENAGGTVEFADINPTDMCLDPKTVNTKGRKAVVVVDLAGNVASRKYDIPVIVDSAHRIEYGQCAEADYPSCFSFYATKNITTGEGGMVATNDKKFYEWLLMARHHGIKKDKPYSYSVEFTGWKANLPDILSCIGLEQIRKIDDINYLRRWVVDSYNVELETNWMGLHLYPYMTDNPIKFIEYMKENGVQCSRHFQPLHKMPAFRKHNNKKLFVTELIGMRIVSLPLFPGMKKKEVKYICKLIKEYEKI